MPKFILLFIYLLISSLLFAQKVEKKWAITLNPSIIPLPEKNFCLQGGVEHKIQKNLSLLTEIVFQKGINTDTNAFNRTYIRIKPELRFLFSPAKNKIGKSVFQPYVGLQVSGGIRTFKDRYGYYLINLHSDSVIIYDIAKIKSPVKTVSIQWGVICFTFRRIFVDLFNGIGLRFINTSYSEVVNPRASFRSVAKDWFTLTPSYQQLGGVIRLQLNGGFRFMYQFGHFH
jgi:hypothetical protein